MINGFEGDHGIYKGIPRLDLNRLSEILQAVSISLVLHGTSGVPDETVKECIRRGICKEKYATDLRIAFNYYVTQYLVTHPDTLDPKKYGATIKKLRNILWEKSGCVEADSFLIMTLINQHRKKPILKQNSIPVFSIYRAICQPQY